MKKTIKGKRPYNKKGKIKNPAVNEEANKIQKATKVAAGKALVEIASSLPHGAGKEFLIVTKELDDIETQQALLNKRKRGCRAKLKEMKIELRPYDHVRKLRKMLPEDMQSFEASIALYKDQLSMTLSVHQQVIKKEIVDRREAARDAMIDASGGDTGQEIGSSVTIFPSGENALPEKNDEFSPEDEEEEYEDEGEDEEEKAETPNAA